MHHTCVLCARSTMDTVRKDMFDMLVIGKIEESDKSSLLGIEPSAPGLLKLLFIYHCKSIWVTNQCCFSRGFVLLV